MPTPLESVKSQVELIGGKFAVSELSMEDAFMELEFFKDWTTQEISQGIVDEILKNPNFIIHKDESHGNITFGAQIGVIFNIEEFVDTLRNALSAEYNRGYRKGSSDERYGDADY